MVNPTFEVGQSFTIIGIVKRNRRALDLTGATDLEVKLKKPSGDYEVLTPVVTDATGGRWGASVLASFNDEVGQMKGRFTGLDAAGETLNGSVFRISIKRAF